MAHKKAGGSSRNGRDSIGQRRGIKKFGGENVKAGNIIVRPVIHDIEFVMMRDDVEIAVAKAHLLALPH